MFTHYWTVPEEKEIHPEALEAIKNLIDHGKESGMLRKDKRFSDHAHVSRTGIVFNGEGSDAYAPFIYEPTRTRWNFCKTNRNSYDVYVCSALLILKYFHPDLRINSDGRLVKGEWIEAVYFLLFLRAELELPTNLLTFLMNATDESLFN